MKSSIKAFLCGLIIGSVGVTGVVAAGNIKSAVYNSNKVVFNGKVLDLSDTPMISVIDDKETNTSNYMPVQPVLEQMGYDVDWNGDTNTVNIKNKASVVAQRNSNDDGIQVVTLVNKQRAQAGMAQLTYSQEVSDIAYLKAKDMADSNYFEHNSPTYGTVADMFKNNEIKYRALGENIAKGYKTPEEVVNAWMNSSAHKENILFADYTEIGIGIYEGSDGVITWVQMFLTR